MSIDSTSKMPWFGLELKGRKPKSDGPEFRSVRADQGAKSRIDTLARSSKGGAIESAGLTSRSSNALPLTERALLSDSTKMEVTEIDFR